MKNNKYNWLPDFVYGGIDGSVTTFAIVAGVVGADLSTPVILILGFANLFADGFSMAVGKYSSDKAELELINHVKEKEKEAIKKRPLEEKEEIRVILKDFGFKGNDLERAEKVITSDPEAWLHIMLHHEFHMIEENINPKKGAIATFLAFQTIGLIPLLGYTFQAITNSNSVNIFYGTAISTLVALFIVGTIKTRFTDKNWLLAGLETAAIGGMAATIAYFVGVFLSQLLSVS